MRIERIDEKTVKCYLSVEELQEYELDYKDFLARTDKANEIMHEIMDQAREEVGYRPGKYVSEVQIMMMPHQGMVLTFNEKDSAEEDATDQMAKFINEIGRMILNKAMPQKKPQPAAAKERPAQTAPAADALRKQKEAKPKEALTETAFVFDTLSAVMDFAGTLPVSLRVHSALFTKDGKFYLLLCKGGASMERFQKTCVRATEFAAQTLLEPAQIKALAANSECLIAEKAIQKLK